MNKSYFFAAASILLSLFLSAQTESNLKVYKVQGKGVNSAQNLFQSLVGEGIILKSYSITKSSSDEAFGFFEDSKASLGMKKGLIMTTGGITSLCARNTMPNMSNNTHRSMESRLSTHEKVCESPELEKFLSKGQKTFDACVLEMDIVPTADTLSFNYVFGSEEYDEFVGSNFNDVFAFFISGKGITGEKNLAVVPGTEIPVSVNTINHGSNGSYHSGASNPSYYVSNVAGNIAIEYDGLTKLMEIRQPVTPYEVYHIKLAIADVADASYDSGVLLEGKSIISYKKHYSVMYDKNSCEIEKGYKTLLDNLAAQYKKQAGKILITGHTDSEGEEQKNFELSCCRANAVSSYLQAKGIEESRIIIDCKGETMPAFSNVTEQGKANNRRVDVKLLGEDQEYNEKRKADQEKVTEEKSKLLSNYPNPFGAYTTLEAYIVDGTKDASIIVTDLTGNTVKTIHMMERGKTSTQFDGSFLANGIYSAMLFADGVPCGTVKLLVTR